ncbi:MAG: B12-binding domain-containing radical SAM protein [Candidatus Omnitrophota bacterium]|nr:MAG: B12-binding domain-containing radical SAM protein [Candidatus Omnitrophota bacterium]
MSKKILLLKIENKFVYNPLGLLYVGSYLKNNGYDVELEIVPLKSFTEDSFVERKAKKIAEGNYLFVGFSVLTGPQTKFSAILSKKIKEFDNKLPIVWGGVHPSLVREQTLKEPYVDIIVMGEGEKTALELASALLSQDRDLSLVRGIGYKKTGELIFNQGRELIKDLDEIQLDWSLVDMKKCLLDVPGKNVKDFSYITSRGCPHFCSFCYNKTFHKRKWRTHSLERIISDIKQLKKNYGMKTVSFLDDHFFVNKNRSFEILSRLKDIDVNCTGFLLRIDEITEDSVKRLYDLGVKSLFIGIESGNDRILSLMNKNTNKKMILEKFSILSQYKDIAIGANKIIGYPTETMEEIEDSLDLSIKLSELIPGIVVTYNTFLPYPGTEAYQLALQEGFRPPLTTEDYEIYDTFGGSMPISWLPWQNKNTRELFFRIDKYAKLLTRSKSTSALRTLGKNLFHNMAKFRLKHRFFAFPFEIFVLFRFNRYYNPDCKI